jgi:hypothetical protein
MITLICMIFLNIIHQFYFYNQDHSIFSDFSYIFLQFYLKFISATSVDTSQTRVLDVSRVLDVRVWVFKCLTY